MSPAAPLAVIAGAGALPLEVAREAAAMGRDVVILPVRGFASGPVAGFASRPIDLLDPAGALRILGEIHAAAVVLVGAVHRPNLGMVAAGWQAVRHRDELRAMLAGGDDNLLRGVVRILESNGFPVVGLRDVAPRLMAPAAVLTSRAPDAGETADIERGFVALSAMAPADIGQALTLGGGRIIAVEASEGTDAMIRRTEALRRRGVLARILRHGRAPLAERAGGVLVKAPKRDQDFRVDLPVIGPKTVQRAAAAGLSGIAVEAGGVLVVERSATIAEAERRGLFVVGVAP